MRKWAVIYSSVTGNTKAVAAAMAEEAGADLFRVQEGPADLSGYPERTHRPLSDARRGRRLRARRHLLCARGLSPRRGL